MKNSVPPIRSDNEPKVKRVRAGNEGLARIPAEARPLKGHIPLGSQTDGKENFIPFENSEGY
jgi:hypothetical protein